MDIKKLKSEDNKNNSHVNPALGLWHPKKYIKDSLKKYKNVCCIVTGMSRSGKSYLLHDILKQTKFDFYIVCSRTLESGQYDFIPGNLKFNYLATDVIEKMKELYFKSKKKFSTAIILDDQMTQYIRYEQTISDIFMTGRHFQTSIFVLTQKMSLNSQAWLCNLTIGIVLFSGSMQEKKYISENLVANILNAKSREYSINEEIKKGIDLQTDVCKDYTALVCLPLESEIYTYKAE